MTKRIYAALRTVCESFRPQGISRNPDEVERRYVELDRDCDRLAGELWDAAAAEVGGLSGADAVRQARWAHSEADERIIRTEIIGNLDPRAVHEAYHAWLYNGADLGRPLDPSQTTATRAHTRHWEQRAADGHVAVERVGDPGSYSGVDPIEDLALAPDLPWGDADRKAMLEEAIRIHGLEPGQWIELEWPPTAGLWDPGQVNVDASEHEVVEEMAQWKWLAPLRILELEFTIDGSVGRREVYCDPAHEVAITTQDPREVLVGPPGKGIVW